MASTNGSANGPTAHHPSNSDHEASSSSWTPPRSSGLLQEAASLINRGGLGSSTSSRADRPPPSAQRLSDPTSSSSHAHELNTALALYEKQYLPGHPKSLSGIAIRCFALGISLSTTLLLSIYLLTTAHHPLWRAPFFITILSLFHFLEFYTTAQANTSSARVSSFLFSSNGSAYTIAHTTAFVETLLAHYLFPAAVLPLSIHRALLLLGLAMVLGGQTIRAIAMLTAGPNFSHVVAHTKSHTHQLVSSGIYSVFRHPSYFGFFWWGIGTQLVCGNTLSLVGYVVVLWLFFSRRIEGEEELLVRFFGDEYREYRQRTSVGIPFIK